MVCTTRDATALFRTLRNLLRRSRSDFEERGLRILHLSFGMLQWREQQGSEPVRSPLLLVPVELTRASAQAPYTVAPCEDEPVLNPAFDVKLAGDFGVQLPPLPADREATPNPSRLRHAACIAATGTADRTHRRRSWKYHQMVRLCTATHRLSHTPTFA